MLISVFNAISHFLVDAACVAALFSFGTEALALSSAVIVYNTLAFSTQCLVGLLMDRVLRRDRTRSDYLMLCGTVQAAAMFLVAAAALYPFGLMIKAVLIGLGNSVFHVAGGSVTLDKSAGKAAPLGIFVAPGAFGVTLGVLYPQIIDYICAALGIAAVACFSIYRRSVFYKDLGGTAEKAADAGQTAVKSPADPNASRNELKRKVAKSDPILPVAFLTFAVAVRAIGGSAAEFTWKTGAAASLLLTHFVFLGKALGGFVCDRLGVVKPSIASIVVAAILTAFFAWSMPLSFVGQLLINLSMPVTLWLMYRHIPDYPGLAFGLAASALWPGTLIGGLIKLTGPLQSLLIIVCFLLGLGAIIYSEKVLRK
jgi:FSR family fosmidomycin resistance protein-like MFS transporter